VSSCLGGKNHCTNNTKIIDDSTAKTSLTAEFAEEAQSTLRKNSLNLCVISAFSAFSAV
jgi:hypothetical protein